VIRPWEVLVGGAILLIPCVVWQAWDMAAVTAGVCAYLAYHAREG